MHLKAIISILLVSHMALGAGLECKRLFSPDGIAVYKATQETLDLIKDQRRKFSVSQQHFYQIKDGLPAIQSGFLWQGAKTVSLVKDYRSLKASAAELKSTLLHSSDILVRVTAKDGTLFILNASFLLRSIANRFETPFLSDIVFKIYKDSTQITHPTEVLEIESRQIRKVELIGRNFLITYDYSR